jgi:alpha-mannosidase
MAPVTAGVSSAGAWQGIIAKRDDSKAEQVATLKEKGVDHTVLVRTRYSPHQYRAADDSLSGILEVHLLNPGELGKRVTLKVNIAGKTVQEAGDVPGGAFGRISATVPEALTETEARIELMEEGKTIATDTVWIRGAEEALGYRAYVVSHTHSDLCWPDTPEACMNANLAALAASVAMAERIPGCRFTMEHVLFVREYLRRNPDKLGLLRQLLRAGAIETGAFYTGPWELTCGGEGLVRELYLGKLWVKNNLGVDCSTVWNVDVAGHTLQMPQILNKAGIRGLVISAGALDNTFDNPYLLHETRGPFLFRWQAPDGSTVPTWTTPWGYNSGGALSLRKNTLEELAILLPTFMEDVRKNHRTHALPRIAFITDGTDVQSPTAQVGDNIRKWNAEKRFPLMIHASAAELFGAIEHEPLPTYAGEMPSPWDQVQAQGNDCFLLDRRLEGRLLAAEKFATFASVVLPTFVYPHEQLARIWENRLFALEHNWGGNNGAISNREKTAKIREADQMNETILRTVFEAIGGAIRFTQQDAIPIVVFNPLSWDRKEVVTCALPVPEEKVSRLVIADSAGAVVAHQFATNASASAPVGKVQVVFCADVASLGYATYYATWRRDAPRSPSPFLVELNTKRFENSFFRLELDAATGGLKSVYDKRTRTELIRQNSRYACNELRALEDDEVDIRAHLTGKQWLMRQYPSIVTVAENGPVRLVVEVAGEFLDRSSRKQEIILYRDLARIDLVTTLDWPGTRNVQLYQVFPLNPANPRLTYAVPYGWEQYGSELQYAAPWPFGPLAGYCWRGVRGWIQLADQTNTVTLAAEANCAALQDLGADPEPGFLIQPLLLRTVRSCGDSKLFYEQKGRHQFRFSLRSQADSARFGEEHTSPLLCWVAKGSASPSASLPDRLSFGRIKPDNVQVAVVKKAEDGQGIILRLVETSKTKDKTKTSLRLFKPIEKAIKTNIIEENEQNLTESGEGTSVAIAPLGIETLRVFLSK